MSAEELMKRGKRHLSVALKEECVNKNHVNLNIVLDHLLSKNKEIDDAETLEWCKSIIAGDKTYKEFLEIVKSYNNSSICGLVWTAEYVAYRCHTCGLSPCMSLCMDCFKAADHDGHDFNMFKSQAGGACDCGDESVMDAKGFCPKHSKNKDRSKIEPPKDLLFVAEIMIPRLVVRLVQYLRHSGAEKQYISKMTSFISFLQELSETGDLMQQIFSNVFTSQNDYTTNMINVGVEYDIYQASLKFDIINVNKYFPDIPELADDLIHKTLLDEMFFWVIKSKFPEHLVTFLLSILPNEQYKLAFVEVFVEHYRCMMVELTHSEDKSSVSNSVVHISVQLLSPLKLAIEIVTKFHLIHIMFASLKHIINQARYGNTLNLTSNVMKEHCYWPIVTDFMNILVHPPIVHYFLNSTSLVNAWADVISSLQGLNMNRREHDLHVEFETETYYKAFSAELEICSTPLWALLKHLNDSSSKQLTINIVNILVTYLNKWFTENSVGEIEMNPDEMSFHYPLHRYLSLLISNALQQQGMELTDLLPSLEFLELLYLHPLHLLARFNEINCGLWVRNGQQIKGQSLLYVHSNFSSSTVDPDYFILQLVASHMNPDEMMNMILEKFNVLSTLSVDVEKNRFRTRLQQDQELPMLEACLYFIATLLGVRVLSDKDGSSLLRNEVVSLLCVGDKTHSQLTNSIPNRCGVLDPEWNGHVDAIISQISEFKPPLLFEVSGVLQQGKYVPLDSVWKEEFNPLLVRMRTMYKREYQSSLDRYAQFVKQNNLYNESTSLWPPFRMPPLPHPSLYPLYRLLHCSSMHALIFTLLYKILNHKNINESIIFLTIHLLELVVSLPTQLHETANDGVPGHDVEMKKGVAAAASAEAAVDEDAKMVVEDFQTSDVKKHLYKDKSFETWFPTGDEYKNMRTVIKLVDVDNWSSSSEDDEEEEEGDNDEEDEDDDSFVATESDRSDILPSSNYFVTEDSRLIRKLSQPSATSSGAKHNKRLLSASHSVDNKTVAIDESIISMLIKLHAKFSKNPYKPNPDGAAVDSRIGDGAFFITKVLDKISRNEKCMQYIKTLVTSDEDILGEPKKVPIEEDRRLKAKQRQEKLLNYFASKQQKFLLGNDFIEDAMEDDDKPHDNLLRDNDFMNRVYDCCICNLSTVTSNNRPVCLIAAATPSYVLEHRTMESPVSMEADDDVMQKDSASLYPQASLASSPLPADLLSASTRSSVHLKTSSHSLLSSKSTTSLVVNNEQANSMKYGYCSSVFRQLVDKYKLNDYLVYETPSYHPWYRSLNIQSCGHYLHYDCGLSYIKSLQDRNQSSSNLAISANGDFVCPMCRQVSNIILPLTVPNPLPSSAVEDTTHKIRELLAVSTMETPNEQKWIETLNYVAENFEKIFSLLTDQNYKDHFAFYHSILRNNLELELFITSFTSNPSNNFVKLVKRPCLYSLYCILSTLIRKYPLQNLPDVWDLVTELDKKDFHYSADFCKRLLLTSVIDLFLIFVLALPTHMEKDIYVRLVQKLYNVLYVQLLLNVACNVSLKCLKKFKQQTADASCPIVVKLLCHLTDCLHTYGLHFSDNTEHNNISSTSDVTDFVRKGLTEFLSLVVLLYAHIFQLSDLVEQNYAALSHNELLKELHVTAKVEMNVGNENGEVDIMPMNWSVEEAKLFIGRWCQSVETLHQIVKNENVEKKLYTPAIRWHAPSLISLPNDYDSLFQYYHKKVCESCKQKPKTPVLCLLCGKFLCYNVDCCSRTMYAEHIWHSLECGNGTALYLNIDTSLISIAKGLRNATWISVYLDKHGEEDKNLKRGKPLYLNEERYSLLNQMWITNSFDQFSRQWNFQRIN